jgi:hypothetical protein
MDTPVNCFSIGPINRHKVDNRGSATMRMKKELLGAVVVLLTTGFAFAAPATGEKIKVTGEVADTWCYLSGVMGGADATLGTAHHTCAMWCAAGGIPVGIVGDDGTLYMVLKLEGVGSAGGEESILRIQSHKITAEGTLYKRDGQNYLVVDKVVADAGITNKSHENFGVVPPHAIPPNVVEKVKKQ